MPRGGRGGKRTGKPQSAYGNRTDLHSSIAGPTPNQVYGQGVAQQQALKAVPLPASGTTPPGAAAPPPAPPAPGAPPAGPAPVLPGGLGPIDRPSERPNEPLTAGLSSGPGPGPEALGQSTNPTANMLRGIYSKYPSPGLLALIQEAEKPS